MRCSSRRLQKGRLGGARPATWTLPALMCSCLMELPGAL